MGGGMENILFLQSDVEDPYKIYEEKLAQSAIYYDNNNRIWGIYRFNDCQRLLTDRHTSVPTVSNQNNLASEKIRTLVNGLARLGNPPSHSVKRNIALRLMQACTPADLPHLLHQLIGEPRKPALINWVTDVCMKLPVHSLLANFKLTPAEIEWISKQMGVLTKVMTPVYDTAVAHQLDLAIDSVSPLLTKALEGFDFQKDELDLYVTNILGLLIQAYDAGRGLLSNALIHLLRNPSYAHPDSIGPFVREIIRFDPPVQNTRRVLAAPITLGTHALQPGDEVLIVLAAANRDPLHFLNPNRLQINRSTMPPHLSFGYGAHQCLAEHYMVELTTQTLRYLFSKYQHIECTDQRTEYEPRVNVRLPKRLTLRVS